MYGDIDAGENQCRIDEFKEMTEQHKYHIKQLETLMRMLDNETVEMNQIKKIKDDVEYYIESCQEPVINTTPTQTSTPQTANKFKRLKIGCPSSAPSSSSRRVANTSTPNVPLNQLSPKPLTVIRKSVNRSVKQKTPIHKRTMGSVGRKCYIPEYLERIVLDSSPYGSPFTPKTIVKKSRNNKTMNNTTAVNNTTLFSDTTAIQMHRSFRTTTTQTNDSLRQMSDVCNQTFDV
ncbi:unnamed protein product, partial [Oppiella nova]